VSRRIELPGSSHGEPAGALAIGDLDGTAEVSVTVHLRADGEGFDRRRAVEGFRRFASQHDLWMRDGITKSCLRLGGAYEHIGRAFGTVLRVYDDGSHRFHGRSGPLTVPEELTPWTLAVMGLDRRPLIPRPRLVPEAAPADGDGIWPADVARLYGIAPDPDAAPCVAVIALGGGYSTDDLEQAARANGNQTPAVDARTVSGLGNLPGFDPTGDGELALDLQVLLGLLPSARVLVYFAANNEDGLTSALGQAVSDNEASVVSISWGSAESLWPEGMRDAAESALRDAIQKKITVVAAAGDKLAMGDGDDGRAHVLYPASSPLVLACGGTEIVLDSSGAAIRDEFVWNSQTVDGFEGTGGGISDIFPVPDYQKNTPLPPSPNDGQKRRGTPDVAALASAVPGYRIIVGGETLKMSGTSGAAPLWAGVIAMANAQRHGRLEAVHGRLYAVPSLCREITQGDNRRDGVGFFAGPVWNACTGLGVPTSATVEGLRVI
jgi:kumamolisin